MTGWVTGSVVAKAAALMGLDLRCVAVRLDSARVGRIRVDAAAWDTEVGERRLGRWIPLFVDRSHNQAEYLLDPVSYRRMDSYGHRERSLPYRIIRGDERFADHAVGGQGIPWRCSTAAFLARAVAMIDALDVATRRRQFSVADMDALGVYKVRPTDDDDESFERTLARLRSLADHYRHVARDGLDVIVQLD